MTYTQTFSTHHHLNNTLTNASASTRPHTRTNTHASNERKISSYSAPINKDFYVNFVMFFFSSALSAAGYCHATSKQKCLHVQTIDEILREKISYFHIFDNNNLIF